ncbi:MAG TPA: DUF4097 family beta strand repeat-containing protein, partial [Kofleriaceae bacterium]|nr:DUF4097 family beta strand repeat-containing protein [Kofleriaceae bacterium]
GLAVPGRALADDGPQATSSADAPAADGDGGVVEKAELTVAPGKRPIRAVSIDNPLGDVRIEGNDGTAVTIVSIKHAPDADTLERLRVTLVPDPDGTVRLTSALGDSRERPPAELGAIRIDLVVRVPHGAKVEGRVGHGRLEAKDLDAGAELDAGTGDIVVSNVAGGVLARSVEGDQHFARVFGDLDAHALDAQLELDTVRGQNLTAQVYKGAIDGRHLASRRVRLTAVHGDITLATEAQPGQSIVVASLDGSVNVTVHGQGRVRVRARAGGTLTLAGAAPARDRWVEQQYGAGRASGAIQLQSRYGDVSFSLFDDVTPP